jgi:hypothetical protein
LEETKHWKTNHHGGIDSLNADPDSCFGKLGEYAKLFRCLYRLSEATRPRSFEVDENNITYQLKGSGTIEVPSDQVYHSLVDGT